ncbi:MAG: NADH-quinone oxidoreductase subunit L [Candidatus Omnitrophica bacterium CG11_big_fil_rev_8_21_14_0_20_63_9]|nr:MAG: NADH-quinone oxidoreductase subunit L [Candidatus Omnitrophica bacterium CG11_big_fil_rev_8_21_14_0_20_63_9]
MVISPSALGWTILLSPLAAACGIQLFGVHRRRLSATLAIGALLVSFASTLLWYTFSSIVTWAVPNPFQLPFEASLSWISLPGLTISFGVLIDQLSLLMALVVTGVGSAIFIYSTAYMADDDAYSRYFGVLSLFAFSMLTIVLATNWIQLFMGWELVGFSSYLLIGHWYAKPSAAEAGKKAFMVNRVADFGFMLGILALWAVLPVDRTFHFQTLEKQLPLLIQTGVVSVAVLPLIGLLLFCGPIGKSAQFPLHVWLPDAMEGPTPVSALIHAATMVAAGVYMLCRTFWLFEIVPSVLTTITWVGAATAFLAACLALVEFDLKRILAYSTLSQLGYMVMALGLGGAVAGMYHLTTHAFFKALLFLAAGSVIHGTHEQDIRKLGGLWHSMRWTSLAFLVGGLALCGFPGLSGFFSKDEILVLAYGHNAPAFWLALVTAGMTAFYTARAWFIAFTGKAHGHGHESPPAMLIPLGVLAFLSIIAGYIGIPHFLGQHGEHHAAWLVPGLSIAVVAVGLLLAWLIYSRGTVSAQQLVQALALPYSFLQRRYYIDEIYMWYVETVQQRWIAGACAWVERVIIIGFLVNGTARLTRRAGHILRLWQTGRVQTYVLGFLLGIVSLLTLALRR